jgi:protein involved in polysaccharide export with SLBB domain
VCSASVCILALLTLFECRAQEATPLTAVDFIDRIHPGDLIDIHVAGYLEYDWRGSLTPEGFLDGYPHVAKQIFAQCLTEGELANVINGALSETLRDPKAEVRIVDHSKRPYATVDGAVRTPQRIQFRRPARLNEIIIIAGGFTDRASGQIIISRPSNASCIGQPRFGRHENFNIAVGDILSGKQNANPVIVSGDLIVVIEASPVYLLGAVQGQGKIDYRPDLTVNRAIAAAGGLSKNAIPQKVKIFRRDGGSAVIAADVAKIRAKQTDDIQLRPFDIIDIPFKGRPPKTLPPVFDTEKENDERRGKLPVKIIE